MSKKDEALKLAQDLRILADRFSEGWHDGIKIDVSDIVLLSDAAEALAEQPAQQERTDYAVHLNHCNIGEYEGVCKYLDDDCPALKHADMKAKWDLPTPQPAQQEPIKQGWDVDTLLDKPIPLKDFYGPAQQEPVAIVDANDEGYWAEVLPDRSVKVGQPLYTSPPAKQEPAFYRHEDGHLMTPSRAKFLGLDLNELQPLYTSPPVQQNIRNATLDEIADKIAAMPFGDTAASFAVWIREQKT